MDFELILLKVFALWRVVLPAMFLGCLFGNWIQETRFWDYLSRRLAPVMQQAGLPANCSLYLAMCFFNLHAANAYLGSEFQKSRIGPSPLLGAYLLGSFPNSLYFGLFYIAPILIGAVGWRLGTAYTALHMLIGLLTGLTGFVLGRSLGSSGAGPEHPGAQADVDTQAKRGFRAVVSQAWQQFLRMAKVFVPVTLFFIVLTNLPAVQHLIETSDELFAAIGLSGPVVLVLAAGLPSTLSGLAAAGSLFQAGQLSGPEVISALLMGYFLHIIYEFFANHLPLSMTFFGPKNGIRLSTVHLITRLVFITLIIAWIFLEK